MRIAITGPKGFVGSSLIPVLEEAGHTVISLDRQRLSAWRDREERDILPECEVFLHLAWEASMGAGRGDLALQMENVALTLEMVDLAKAMNAKTFVGVGTITELDAEEATYGASQAPGAALVYGEAKRVAHKVASLRAAQVGLEFVWVRLGNIVAPGDRTGRFFISTLEKLLRNEALTFNSSGEQFIDFAHQEDANRALLKVLERGEDGAVYYVGNGTPRPLKERVEQMKEVVGSSSSLTFTGDPATEKSIPQEGFSMTPLEALGHRPSRSFQETVEDVAAAVKREG